MGRQTAAPALDVDQPLADRPAAARPKGFFVSNQDSAAAGTPPLSTIVYLALAAGVSAMTMRINDALLPQLAQTFGVPLATTAQVVSLYALAYGATQALWGPVGDRFGKYRVVGWVMLGCMLASAACALAGSFGQLRAARVVSGMLGAAIIPLAIAWIGDVVPYERRQPVLARFLIGQITGLAAGVWLGGVAADHLGWRTPYWVLTVLYGLAGTQLLIGRRRLAAEHAGHAASAAQPLSRMAADFRQALRQREGQHVPLADVAQPQRIVQRQRMGDARLVEFRRDDEDVVAQPPRNVLHDLEARRVNAVVIGNEDFHAGAIPAKKHDSEREACSG